MKGRVIKKIADKFLVGNDLCVARGQLKTAGVFVGDFVEYDPNAKIICSVKERKNLFVRPPIANVDKMIIVIAPIPKPDFVLVDKLIVFCLINNVEPILCVNKSDILSQQQKKKITNIYGKLAKLCFVSAKEGKISALSKFLGGLSVFAGQSAVGKSSILNELCGEEKEKIGSLSKKVDRGKQTTRTCSIYKTKQNKLIADTAGFSKLDERLFGISERQLADYFIEFKSPAQKCKFASCSHIKERDCGVKKAVKEGIISDERYSSFAKIYEVLKENKRYEKKG